MIMRLLDARLRGYAWWRKLRGLPEPVSVRFDEVTKEAIAAFSKSANFLQNINKEYGEGWDK